MRNSFVDVIVGACRQRDDVVILSGDAGLGVFDALQQELPGSFLNCGIAEQNMASFGAGMALTGHKVFLYNIIPFLLYRCYEQVRNDICYQKLPVVLVGTGSGVTYAPAGISHYAVEDLGLARTLPNLTVISPADPVEARAAARYALTAQEPVYVRIAKSGERPIAQDTDFDIRRPRVVRDGSDVAVVFHGSIADEVTAACDALAADGAQPMLVSVPMVQPLDEKGLCELLGDMQGVVCVEEHLESCGLGSRLKCLQATHRPSWSLQALGIPDRFRHEVCDRGGLRRHFGIAAGDIRQAVLQLKKRGGHG